MEKVNPRSCAQMLDEVRQYLCFLNDIGCTGIGPGPAGRQIAEQWDNATAQTSGGLEEIKDRIVDCRRCRLADERRAVVFGYGNPRARIMFIGPFPEIEDQQDGIPYSGEAGALLTRIIEAIGQSRESVYISHAVKCRPQSDRRPDKFEARACRKHLDLQIQAVSPEVICLLGGFAAQALLRTESPISRIRGAFLEYQGICVMPTYEPAYLLVNPEAKRAVWEDMKKVMARISH